MPEDIRATFGLDDAAFQRGLSKVDRDARVAGTKTGRSMEEAIGRSRLGKAFDDAGKGASKFFLGTHNLARSSFVAVGASIGIATKALEKYGEVNSAVMSANHQVVFQAKGLWEDVGRAMSGVVHGGTAADALSFVRRVYRFVSDGFTDAGPFNGKGSAEELRAANSGVESGDRFQKALEAKQRLMRDPLLSMTQDSLRMRGYGLAADLLQNEQERRARLEEIKKNPELQAPEARFLREKALRETNDAFDQRKTDIRDRAEHEYYSRNPERRFSAGSIEPGLLNATTAGLAQGGRYGYHDSIQSDQLDYLKQINEGVKALKDANFSAAGLE